MFRPFSYLLLPTSCLLPTCRCAGAHALTRVGAVILPDSDAAEQLSEADRKKRADAWTEKKAKLKNPNFVVSKVRLSVRNIPLALDEKQLRKLFLNAAGDATPGKKPVVKQVRRAGPWSALTLCCAGLSRRRRSCAPRTGWIPTARGAPCATASSSSWTTSTHWRRCAR